MTVTQLIEVLNKLPGSLEVLAHGPYEWNRVDYVADIKVQVFRAEKDDHTYYLTMNTGDANYVSIEANRR